MLNKLIVFNIISVVLAGGLLPDFGQNLKPNLPDLPNFKPTLPSIGQNILSVDCSKDVKEQFRRHLYECFTRLYKKVAGVKENHFVLSQYSIWREMAAFTEITDGKTQQELFDVLNIPKEYCLREKYYDLAKSLEISGDDVTLSRKRVFASTKNFNTSWIDLAKKYELLDFVSIQENETAKNLLKIAEALDLNGTWPKEEQVRDKKGLLLDNMDFTGQWYYRFNESETKEAPFYDDDGKEIGKVNMMHLKMKIKLAYLPILNSKVIDLPFSNDERYKFLMLVPIGPMKVSDVIKVMPHTIIIEIIDNLLESAVPLSVAIPRFEIDTEVDEIKDLLKELGITKIWEDVPIDGMYHRSTLKLTESGSKTVPEGPKIPGLGIGQTLTTGLANAVGVNFIANRPFLFALLDKVTHTCLFTGAYSKPSLV